MLWVLLWLDGFKSDWNGSLKPLWCVKDTLQNRGETMKGAARLVGAPGTWMVVICAVAVKLRSGCFLRS